MKRSTRLARASNDAKVRLDLDGAEFQHELFALEKDDVASVIEPCASSIA